MIYCLNCDGDFDGEIFLTKETQNSYLVCFDETFEDIILFIENPFKLKNKKFRNIRILRFSKEEKINIILKSNLINENIKKKIKLYFNI
jgi:folylpolyglutamate synthase/dihydrofolate synthase